MKKFFPFLAVITAMLIWSASGIATKIALTSFTPMSLIVVRFVLAVSLMLLIGLLLHRNSMLGLQRLEKKDIPLFLMAGIAQPFLYYILETYAYRYLSSPTVAEALLSTSPLLSPIFAFVLLRERVNIYNVLGIVVSTIGVFLLIFVGAENFELGNPAGVALAFAAVSSAILYTICLRRMPARYNALSIVFYVQLISLILFIPTWIIIDHPNLTDKSILAALNSRAILSVLYLAALSSVTAFILFCYTVRHLGVVMTNAFNNVRPVFTAIIMLVFFSEQLPIMKWIGIFLIIIGLFICQKQEKSVKS